MELSKTKARDSAQMDLIGRRTSIVPDSRDTRAPALRPSGDMRTARRGDGGADELMRTLGLLQNTGKAVVETLQAKDAVQQGKDMERGLADQQTGAVDEKFMAKSDGYRNAVTKGRTMTEFNAGMRKMDTELRGLIEQQNSPDLETRKGEVMTRLETFYHDFARDPDTGELREFMKSPGALRYLAEHIGKTRSQFEGEALARIETRFNEEALGYFSTTLMDQALSVGEIDLPLAMSTLPKTVPEAAIRSTALKGIQAGADKLRAAGRYAEAAKLLDSVIGYTNTPIDPGVGAVDPGNPSATPSAPTALAAPAAAPTNGRVGFDKLAAAVMWKESRGNPNAVSPKGAVGTMQTMPTTLTDPGYGVKPAQNNTPAELERVGKDYLKAMLREYNGDLVLALSAYNAGPARANAWKAKFAGKTQAQKIASIPIAETKDYVQTILGRVGVVEGGDVDGVGVSLAPDDPITKTPGFRLAHPDADPITAYEQTAKVAPLKGIEKLKLTAEDITHLREVRSTMVNAMKAEWQEKRIEEQGFNASGLALRLYGQGAPLSSVEITRAVERGEISPQHGMNLFGLLRQNANATTAYQDRVEAKARTAEADSREKLTASLTGKYVGALLRGEMTGPQARAGALADLPKIKDPRVQAAVANAVLSTANDVEQLALNSKPVRDTARRINESKTAWVQIIAQGKTPARAQAVAPQVEALLDQASNEYALEIRDGAKPDEAEKRVMQKYKPQLEALRSQR